MNWDAIGAIGEIIGAIGVIASLLYLSIQIRASNRASKNALIQELQDTTKVVLHKNADEAKLYIAGLKDFNSLDEQDQFKFRCLFEVSMTDHARIFHLRNNGEIDDWICHSWDYSLADLATCPGVRQWFEKYGREFMDPEFRSHFAKIIETNTG